MIEADFLREYRLDCRQILALSWRAFITLLGGLSSNSVLVNTVHNRPIELSGPEAEAAIDSMFR